MVLHRPVELALLHGTSGQSEGWSQVVEQLASHRSVIRPSFAEPVARIDSVNAPRVSDFADRVVSSLWLERKHKWAITVVFPQENRSVWLHASGSGQSGAAIKPASKKNLRISNPRQ